MIMVISLFTVVPVAADAAVPDSSGDVSIRAIPDPSDVSNFEFELLDDDTYRVKGYTQSAENLTELVIPESYDGKAVTVVGEGSSDNLFQDRAPSHPFTVVLNKNITEIDYYAFNETNVSVVTGDTSGLKKIGGHAFSGVNSANGNSLDFNFDYPGQITVNGTAFKNANLTARMKHSTTFSRDPDVASINYIFTDAHIIVPEWQWADDYSSASLNVHCEDTRCTYSETFEADVTKNITDGRNYHNNRRNRAPA